MMKSRFLPIIVMFSLLTATGVVAQEIFSGSEAMSDQFRDELFIVREPVEGTNNHTGRPTVVLERSGGLVLIDNICLDESYYSRTGRVWFALNSRGSVQEERDALQVLIAKWKLGDGETRRYLQPFRNSTPWFRGGNEAHFRPLGRGLERFSLREWNIAHLSGRHTRYDRLFGGRTRDEFHGSVDEYGPSSSISSGWWALSDFETDGVSELIVQPRMFRFSRTSPDRVIPNSIVSFPVTAGDFEYLQINFRTSSQRIPRSYEMTFASICSD